MGKREALVHPPKRWDSQEVGTSCKYKNVQLREFGDNGESHSALCDDFRGFYVLHSEYGVCDVGWTRREEKQATVDENSPSFQ